MVKIYMKDFQIFINNNSQYHIFLDAHIGVGVLGYWISADHKLIIFPSKHNFTWLFYFCHTSLWHLKLKHTVIQINLSLFTLYYIKSTQIIFFSLKQDMPILFLICINLLIWFSNNQAQNDNTWKGILFGR